MKTLMMFVSLLVGFAMAESVNYEVDKAHSSVGFTISHMTVSEVQGSFLDYKATIAWDDKAPTASKIDVTLPIASIDTRSKQRDEHLQKPDFFDAAKFPEIHVVSKSLKSTSATTYDLTADITIHGVTKTITFPLTVTAELQNPMSKQMVRGLGGSFKISRKEFKVGENFPAAMVGDDVSVKFAVEAGKKVETKK